MASINKLTAVGIAKLHKRGRYGDGLGLYLKIAEGGSRSWIFRFKRHGKAHQMGLGPTHAVDLKRAREKARECRALLAEGVDPLTERDARRATARAAAAKSMTFEECARAYIAAHEAAWKNRDHIAQWKASLKNYAFPVIGSLPVNQIDTHLVLRCIEQPWRVTPETASRVRSRIEAILDWAKVRGLRDGENPARWRGHLDKMLPAKRKVQKVEHHAALAYAEIGSFMAALRAQTGTAAWALEWLILCASRMGEVLGARWSEIDIETGVWTIPASRMKAGKPHRVPLPKRALEILQALPRDTAGDYVFIGGKTGAPLSKMALPKVLQRLGRTETTHGFRACFRTWCAEQTNFPREICEAALSHNVGSEVERAYQRSDALQKRAQLMTAWAAYCARPSAAAGVVVPLRGRSDG